MPCTLLDYCSVGCFLADLPEGNDHLEMHADLDDKQLRLLRTHLKK
jgi:hypothetical protein